MNLTITLLSLSALFLLLATLLRILSSPLNRVPGPWYSRYTSLPLKWHELYAQRTRFIHSLHRRYGPVVRIAPGEVVFASAAAVKEIYCSGGSGYDKTEFYDLFKVYGRRTMFTTLGKEDVSTFPPFALFPSFKSVVCPKESGWASDI